MNVVVVGPPRCGKTQLVHAICGVKTAQQLRPTTCVSHMACTLQNTQFILWDTPGCLGHCIPNLAEGIVSDCDVAIVCYDGRRCWSPVELVKTIGKHRCYIYLTQPCAFNALFAYETFDLCSSLFNLVPIHVYKDSMLCDILSTMSDLHEPCPEDEMRLVDSV